MGDENRTIAQHPSGEQLVAFASVESDSMDAMAIADHVARCAGCAGTVARYRMVQDVLRAVDAPEPPAAVVARAKNLFAAAARHEVDTEPDHLAGLRRVVARLVFDSGAGLAPALAGFRGGGDRHLTYVAAAVQVDLRLRPPAALGGAWSVQGQVDADKHVPATAVDMVRAGEEDTVARATTDEHGMFALAAPAGLYDILVRLPCALQVLPGLELG